MKRASRRLSHPNTWGRSRALPGESSLWKGRPGSPAALSSPPRRVQKHRAENKFTAPPSPPAPSTPACALICYTTPSRPVGKAGLQPSRPDPQIHVRAQGRRCPFPRRPRRRARHTFSKALRGGGPPSTHQYLLRFNSESPESRPAPRETPHARVTSRSLSDHRATLSRHLGERRPRPSRRQVLDVIGEEGRGHGWRSPWEAAGGPQARLVSEAPAHQLPLPTDRTPRPAGAGRGRPCWTDERAKAPGGGGGGALLVADKPGQMPAGRACAWLGEPPLRPLPPHSAASPGRLHVRP